MKTPRPIVCEEALRRLLDFLNHELSGEHRAEVEQHMRICQACCSRAEFESRLKRKLNELEKEPASPEMRARIRSLLGG
jgi:anti-sigma factor (TIGR02949 family)